MIIPIIFYPARLACKWKNDNNMHTYSKCTRTLNDKPFGFYVIPFTKYE